MGVGGLATLLLLGLAAAVTPWSDILSSKPRETPVFARIESGTFEMGSHAGENGRSDNETQHVVTIGRSFEIQTTEVTQGQWLDLMGSNPSFFADCGDDCPVENISWWDALAFLNLMSAGAGFEQCYEVSGCIGSYGVDFRCEKVVFKGLDCTGYRLPTEAEWEFAARGKTSSPFYSGGMVAPECEPRDPNLEQIAWYCGNSGRTTHPVGSKLPNRHGLSDMLGNVREWVWDWNFGDYTGEEERDPLGPPKGAGRTYRGGGWMNYARDCRVGARGYQEPDRRADSVGVRPVRTLTD